MAVALSDGQLEAARRRGFSVAYRMLGSVAEAEDVAQEAVFRLASADEPIDEPAAWVTTAATRLSINVLRSARVRRESYVGPWLPEPFVEAPTTEPGTQAELAESLSQAFLVLLERLSPLERAAFLLREAFDYEYAEIATIVDRTESAVRQLVSRAKKHLGDAHRRFDADQELCRDLLGRFLAAADDGDIAQLEELLAEDAAVYSDGGGKVTAARKPVFGAHRIARVMVAMTRTTNRRRRVRHEFTTVNGQPGVVTRSADGTVWSVLSIDVLDGRIQTVRIVRNPDKLAHI